MHRNLDIRLLRAYLAIVETGGFTSASERLHLTQSAVSNQLKRLETMLGTQLVDRNGKGDLLTEEGRLLLSFARQILKVNDEAVAAFLRPEITGIVRIGIVEEVASGFFSEALARYNRRHRHVQIELTIGLTRDLRAKLERDELDLVIGKRPAHSEGVGEVLYRDNLEWVVHRQVEIHPTRPVPLVLSPAPCIHREAIVTALESRQRQWRVACHAPTLTSVKAAVMARVGISALDSRTVEPDMRILGEEHGFPRLPPNEVALYQGTDINAAATDLCAALTKGTMLRESSSQPRFRQSSDNVRAGS